MKRFDRRSWLRYSGGAAASLALRTKAVVWADNRAPLVTTTAGEVSGAMENGVNVFKGISYGGDTAKTRFQAPTTPRSWKGVLDCTSFTTMAPQLAARAPAGGGARNRNVQSEDCLHLNV